jgi:hypothetical protein
MSATDYNLIEFTPGNEWTKEDEALFQSTLTPLKQYFAAEIWGDLEPTEKATCIAYRRALSKNSSVPAKLIIAVNKIHERHGNFHIGHMPKDIA